MDEFIFTAPDGCPIQGLMQHDTATWAIRWTEDNPAMIDFIDSAAPDGADWNNVEWHDEALYIDNNGTAWFARHLIRAGAEERHPNVIEEMREEIAFTERAHLARQLALTWDHVFDEYAYRTWKAEADAFLERANMHHMRWRMLLATEDVDKRAGGAPVGKVGGVPVYQSDLAALEDEGITVDVVQAQPPLLAAGMGAYVGLQKEVLARHAAETGGLVEAGTLSLAVSEYRRDLMRLSEWQREGYPGTALLRDLIMVLQKEAVRQEAGK